MAHSTVDLVMPCFLGSASPPPCAHWGEDGRWRALFYAKEMNVPVYPERPLRDTKTSQEWR